MKGVNDMPTENPRVTFTLSEDLLKRIDDYRYEQRMRSQTQAIVSLIYKGIEALNIVPVTDAPTLTRKENELLSAYRAADERAQADALDMLWRHPARVDTSKEA